MIKRLVSIALIVLAGCAAPAGPTEVVIATLPGETAAPPQPATATLPPEAPLAARVNGVPIYLAVYENEVERRLQARREQGFDLETPEGQAIVAAERAQALEALIEDALTAQAAAQMGISISDAEVDAVIQQSINDAGGQEAFQRWLDSNRMSIEEHRAAQRAAMLNNAVRDRITASVPTEAEQVHARYIVVLTAEEAQQILAQLQAGADFAALAQQYSKDSVTAAKGGDLDWFPRGGLLDEALEEAAFALQPGQISGVVASEFGGQMVYEIVQVLEREAARPLSPERLMFLQRQTFRRWLDELKAQAQIERFVNP